MYMIRMYDRGNHPEMNTRNDEQCLISLAYYIFCKYLYKINICFIKFMGAHVCIRMSVYMFISIFNDFAIKYLVFAFFLESYALHDRAKNV